MILKSRVEQLINEISPTYIRLLRLKSKKITWHVLHTQSKERQQVLQSKSLSQDAAGESYINIDSNADIVIFYDLAHDELDVIGTIVHELLHVRFFKLVSLATVGMKKACREEEQIIRDLEKILILPYLKDINFRPGK